VVRPTALELFKGVSELDARRIARLCTERWYKRGAAIFSEGDPGDAMFIVREGLVRLVSISKKGAETILHLLKPDQIFGELFFSEERRAFNAVASTDALVTIIPRKSFEEILVSFPAVTRNFIRLLSRRLVKVEREFAGFGHTWSYQRLGIVLLRLGKEHGIQTPGGTLIRLRLTHEDLAKLIGTTRETVTTQISKFKRLGLLKRDGPSFILNTHSLVRFLYPEESSSDRPVQRSRRR
jgi:CRP/FNR family transcriptional regulator, cyclic AMP receptor protein